jgi:hypothetical protein
MKRWINFVSGLFGMLALIILTIGMIALFRGVSGISGSSTPAIITQDTPASRRAAASTPTSVPTAALVIPTYTPGPTRTPYPEATPYILPMVDWQAQRLTYVNSTLGFSVQHPPQARIVEMKEEVYITMGIHPSPVGDMSVNFRLQPNPDNLSIEEIYKRDWAKLDNHKETPPILQTVVDDFNHSGHSAARGFFTTEGVVDVFWVLVSHESKIYVIALRFGSYTDMYDPSYQSLFVQIIDTFRFLDK